VKTHCVTLCWKRLFASSPALNKFAIHFTMASQVSPTVKDLLAQVAQLGDGLQNGQPGSREGLLGVCSALIGELSFPMETMLMLLWSQVFSCPYLTSYAAAESWSSF